MSRRVRHAAGLLLAGGLMVGCHAANEGAIDYRYFPPPDPGAVRLARVLGGLSPTVDAPLIDSPLAAGTAQLQRAERKYASTLSPREAATVIRPGEAFAVTLQQAFVADFGEGVLNPADWHDRRGEIAVVAGVRELAPGEAVGDSLDAALESPRTGRVVFYSGDVRGREALTRTAAGQYLNFSAVPLHLGAEYRGGPVEIRLYLLELDDREVEQMRWVLSTMAAFGDRAYPPGSPVLALLDELGGALLSGVPEESVEFRYTCVLHPQVGDSALPQAHLREGNYVFAKRDHARLPPPVRAVRDAAALLPAGWSALRGKDRPPLPDPTEPVDWDRVRFDPLQGRLMAPDRHGQRYRFYEGHTYLTLQVRRMGEGGCEPTEPLLTSPLRPPAALFPQDGPPNGPTAPPVAATANAGSTLPIWTRLPPPADPVPNPTD
jgi:hypothetical protein